MLLRILRFPLTLMVLGVVVFTSLYALTGIVAHEVPALHDGPLLTAFAALSAAVGMVVWRAFQRRIEGRADAELAGAGAGVELAGGLGVGFALFSAVAGLTMLLGGMSVDRIGGLGQLWAMLTMAIASGFYEEVVFRGVMLRHLEALLGSGAGLAITSAFFGLAHFANPGATWFSSFAIALEAGILLGAAFLLTRRLWLAIGIHAGWNFTQGWVFSVPVSGSRVHEGLLVTRFSGPDWLTGGAFGLEAGLVALALATGMGLVLLRRAAARGQLQAAPWRRRIARSTIKE